MRNTFQTVKIFRHTREELRLLSLVTKEGLAEMVDRLVKEELAKSKVSKVSRVVKEVQTEYASKTNE